MPASTIQSEAHHQLELQINGATHTISTSLPLHTHHSPDILDCIEKLTSRVGAPCLESALNFIAGKAAELARLHRWHAPERLVFYNGGHFSWPLEQRTLEVAAGHQNGCSGFAEIEMRNDTLLVKYVSTQSDPEDRFKLLHKTARFSRETHDGLSNAKLPRLPG